MENNHNKAWLGSLFVLIVVIASGAVYGLSQYTIRNTEDRITDHLEVACKRTNFIREAENLKTFHFEEILIESAASQRRAKENLKLLGVTPQREYLDAQERRARDFERRAASLRYYLVPNCSVVVERELVLVGYLREKGEKRLKERLRRTFPFGGKP